LYSNIDKTLIEGLDAASDVRVFDQSRIGDVLLGNPQDLQNGPPVKALFVQNTNPAVVAPESNKVIKGLSRDDLFICVHEQFMTDTAKFADIVLPATMFLEHNDLYVASGHTHIQMTKKVLEPYAECRSNHTVLCQLAERLGLDHPGFRVNDWELCDQTLKASGLPDAASVYDGRWLDVGHTFEDSNFMPSMPDHWEVIDNSSEDYPFRLVAAPARQFLNTSFTETATSLKQEKRPTLMVHTEDMRFLLLSDGQKVRVSSQCGEVIVFARAFDGVQRGVVIMESIWPNSAFEGGVGVNAVISAEPGYPNGGGVFHDTAVAIRALA